MKPIFGLMTIFLAIILVSCKAPEKNSGVWVNKEKLQGKTYNNVFVIVVTADIQARLKLESDLANIITSRGLKAVKSTDVMVTDIKNPKPPTKDEVVGKVKASGCDAVFVASLIKQDEAVKYTEGSTTYAQMPYYSYTGSYYGYYSNVYSTVWTPTTIDHDKNYYMQSNLFDAASEELMWSVTSEVTNPESLDKFSKAYTKGVISKLKKEKLIK